MMSHDNEYSHEQYLPHDSEEIPAEEQQENVRVHDTGAVSEVYSDDLCEQPLPRRELCQYSSSTLNHRL